jgi:hypothetical protein
MQPVSEPINFERIPLNSKIVLDLYNPTFGSIPNIILGKLQQVKTYTYGHYGTSTQVINLIIDDKMYDLSDDKIRHSSKFWIMEESENKDFVPITNDAKYTALCVGGKCVTYLRSGDIIEIEDIKKGMEIALEDGSFGTVKALIQSYADFLFCFGPLSITSYHPIKLNGIWTFPIDHEFDEGVYSITSYEPMPVYSILLEESNGLGIMINDIPVAPLGHGVKDGILEHPFFSNHDSICNALSSLDKDGFDNGFVKVKSTLRDKLTNKIKGFY